MGMVFKQGVYHMGIRVVMIPAPTAMGNPPV